MILNDLSPKEMGEKIYRDCFDLIPASISLGSRKSDIDEMALRFFNYIVSNTIVASPSNWLRGGFDWEESYLIKPEKCYVDAELFWEKVQENLLQNALPI